MAFWKNLLSVGKLRSERESTDAELNTIFVPLRDRICDFKDSTTMSWALILPAVQDVSVRLFVQARGLEATRKVFASMVQNLDQNFGIKSTVYKNFGPPELPEQFLPQMTQLNTILWNVANGMIAKGKPTEHVAQALSAFVAITAKHALGEFGDHYAAGFVINAHKELQGGKYADGKESKTTGTMPEPPTKKASEPLEQLASVARERLDQQNLAEAINFYSAAIQLAPKRPDLYLWRGVTWSNKYYNEGKAQSDLVNAIADYTRAIEINRKYGEAYFQRAGLLQENGETDNALADYSKSIEMGHLVSSCHFSRGRLLQDLARYNESIAEFNASVELADESDREFYLFARGGAYRECGNLEAAVADFNQALIKMPEAVGALMQRADALRELGRIPEAIADLSKVIALRPTDLDAYKQRGQCRGRLGQHELAQEDLRKAADLALSSSR